MSEELSQVLKNQPQTDAAAFLPLDAAVLVTAWPDARMDGSGAAAVGPLTYVAGLPLFLRAVLALQRGGVRRLIVLAGEEQAVCQRIVQQDRRISLQSRWIPIRNFPVHDPQMWTGLADEIAGAFLVLGPRTVLSPQVVDLVRRELQAGETLAIASLQRAPSGDHSVHPPRDADMLAVSPRAIHASELPRSTSPDPFCAADLESWPFGCLLEQASAAGRLRAIAVPASLSQSLRSNADIPLAEQRLLDSLQRGKPEFEGVVDAYLNRRISRGFTRLFLTLRLSPNMITGLSTLIGLLAAAAFAFGTYISGVIGALLLQLSAIVDCCDGEVARITFAESRLGEQLDLFADNVVHVALFAAIAWGVFVKQVAAGTSSLLPLGLGVAAMLANGLSLWLVIRTKRLRDDRRLSSDAQAARVDTVLKKLASRDFSIVLILFALLNWLEWFLWLAAIGSNLFWIMLAWLTRPSSLRPTLRPTPRVST
jgi:phosphatidylglycerophosphate synthase